jgi:hypothetical protein
VRVRATEHTWSSMFFCPINDILEIWLRIFYPGFLFVNRIRDSPWRLGSTLAWRADVAQSVLTPSLGLTAVFAAILETAERGLRV